MKSSRFSKPQIGFTLLAALLAAALPLPFPASGARAQAQPQAPVSFADLAERLRNTVVNIRTTQRMPGGQLLFNGRPIDPNDPNLPENFRHFFAPFGDIPAPERQGQGSGVIISPDGYIATNHHVVQGATSISVVLLDETEYDGRVVGSDPKTDLALVKIDPKQPLAAADWGGSAALRVGDWVMAIGNPFGLAETVTAGIVSAKGRVIGAGPYDDFIQTDASINPGNSGGPLFNMKGQVVGINTAISAQGQGIGFAIPSDLARGVLDQIRKSGSVTRGWLGVGIQRLTKELADSLSLPEGKGVLVSQVYEGSPAQKAGFAAEDVIVQYDGNPVNDVSDLPRLVAATPVGKKVEVVVVRDGKRKTLQPVVAQLEEEGGARPEGPETAPGGDRGITGKLGLKLRPLTPALAKKSGVSVRKGLYVQEVAQGSPAGRAGLEAGDVILDVNRRPVATPKEFAQMAREARNERILLRVARGESYLFVVIRP